MIRQSFITIPVYWSTPTTTTNSILVLAMIRENQEITRQTSVRLERVSWYWNRKLSKWHSCLNNQKKKEGSLSSFLFFLYLWISSAENRINYFHALYVETDLYIIYISRKFDNELVRYVKNSLISSINMAVNLDQLSRWKCRAKANNIWYNIVYKKIFKNNIENRIFDYYFGICGRKIQCKNSILLMCRKNAHMISLWHLNSIKLQSKRIETLNFTFYAMKLKSNITLQRFYICLILFCVQVLLRLRYAIKDSSSTIIDGKKQRENERLRFQLFLSLR